MVAKSNAASDPAGARKLGHASLGVSIAGIVVTVLIIIIAVSVSISSSCPYKYNGVCYRHRSHVGTFGSCTAGVKDSDGYCYYD